MATPATYCLEFYANDDETLQLVVKTDTGTIVDITGATARMQLRETKKSTTYAIEKTATIVGASGEITFTFTDVETGALNPDLKNLVSFVYDVELTWPSGDIETLLVGSVVVKGDITRG